MTALKKIDGRQKIIVASIAFIGLCVIGGVSYGVYSALSASQNNNTNVLSDTENVSRQPTSLPTRAITSKPTNPTKNPTTLKPTTTSPTTIPTTNPTLKPSKIPTINPSINPTQNPTKRPSINPTQNPTKRPSTNPTLNPTKRPSTNPTLNPTNHPTKNPTQNPSRLPTKNPNLAPTSKPTILPSRNPTINPTRNPSKNPIKKPTMNPTKNPSKSPSKNPTKPPAPAQYIRLFKASSTYQGNIGTRSTSTAICTASADTSLGGLECTHIRAFLCYESDDVASFSSSLSFSTTITVYGNNAFSTSVGTWAQLLQPAMTSSLNAAGIVLAGENIFIGCNNGGSTHSTRTCSNWQSNVSGSGSIPSLYINDISYDDRPCYEANNFLCVCIKV